MTSSPTSTKPEADQDQQITPMRKSRPKFVFGMPSPVARQEQLFLSEYQSDVVFRVGSTGQLIHAHKLILTVASEVFFAQFNGGFAEAKQDNCENPIVIEDIEPEIFTQVLRFIYCEKIQLTADNIMDVYCASQKYLLTGLNRVCKAFLKTTLNQANVMKIFNANRRYGLTNVDEICLKIIQDNPIKCFQSADFLTLNQTAVEMIAACRTMNCQKEQLCEAIKTWCKANSSKEHIKPQWEALQCRKLYAFSTFRYAADVSTNFVLKVKGRMYLHGLGVFIGCKSLSSVPSSAVVTVKIDPWINESKTVMLKEDMYVEEILFEKLTITNECRINVTIPSIFLKNKELFCLTEFKPVDTLGAIELAISDTALGFPGSTGPNCVAYLLFSLDPTVPKGDDHSKPFNFEPLYKPHFK